MNIIFVNHAKMLKRKLACCTKKTTKNNIQNKSPMKKELNNFHLCQPGILANKMNRAELYIPP